MIFKNRMNWHVNKDGIHQMESVKNVNMRVKMKSKCDIQKPNERE